MAKKKIKRNVPYAHAHIKSTFNNTIISVSDPDGAVLSWVSSGQVGFKGSRKSTPFAAQLAADSLANNAKEFGVRKVDVFMKGPGPGKTTAMRALQTGGLEIGKVVDVTPKAHNGCRPKKKERLAKKK